MFAVIVLVRPLPVPSPSIVLGAIAIAGVGSNSRTCGCRRKGCLRAATFTHSKPEQKDTEGGRGYGTTNQCLVCCLLKKRGCFRTAWCAPDVTCLVAPVLSHPSSMNGPRHTTDRISMAAGKAAVVLISHPWRVLPRIPNT